MALIVDYTNINYDSFFTIVEMDAYTIAVQPAHGTDGGWSDLSDADKESRILLAVNYINIAAWNGILHVDIIAPSMTWPRTGLTYKNGVAVSETVTPDAIGLAMSCWILSAIKGEAQTVNSGQLKKKTVGPVSVEYTTDADFIEKTTQTASDSCLTTYIPTEWVLTPPGALDPLLLGMGSVGLIRNP